MFLRKEEGLDMRQANESNLNRFVNGKDGLSKDSRDIPRNRRKSLRITALVDNIA